MSSVEGSGLDTAQGPQAPAPAGSACPACPTILLSLSTTLPCCCRLSQLVTAESRAADARSRLSKLTPQAAELGRREASVASELAALQQRAAAKESLVGAEKFSAQLREGQGHAMHTCHVICAARERWMADRAGRQSYRGTRHTRSLGPALGVTFITPQTPGAPGIIDTISSFHAASRSALLPRSSPSWPAKPT